MERMRAFHPHTCQSLAHPLMSSVAEAGFPDECACPLRTTPSQQNHVANAIKHPLHLWAAFRLVASKPKSINQPAFELSSPPLCRLYGLSGCIFLPAS